MSRVFISYRRSDTQMAAGRLRESLSTRFGKEAIFRDKDSIAGGEDWVRAIKDGLKEDAVVLVLIGPNWLAAQDEAGQRRLDDPGDWNRVEIEEALRLRHTVVPVLVDSASMPPAAQLPESLKGLARANAVRLRDDDWDSDVERLGHVLGMHGLTSTDATGRAAPSTSGSQRTLATGIAVAAVALLGAGAWLYLSPAPAPGSVSGSWAMTHFNEDNSKRAGTLTLEQSGQMLMGTIAWAAKGAAAEISRGSINGSTVEFEAVGPRGARRLYRGELNSAHDLIQGSAKGGSSLEATWSAARQTNASR